MGFESCSLKIGPCLLQPKTHVQSGLGEGGPLVGTTITPGHSKVKLVNDVKHGHCSVKFIKFK